MEGLIGLKIIHVFPSIYQLLGLEKGLSVPGEVPCSSHGSQCFKPAVNGSGTLTHCGNTEKVFI